MTIDRTAQQYDDNVKVLCCILINSELKNVSFTVLTLSTDLKVNLLPVTLTMQMTARDLFSLRLLTTDTTDRQKPFLART